MKRPTPVQVARFGHIAAFLREQMKTRGFTKTADLNRLLGLDGGNAVVFKWLSAQGAPSPKSRERLAKTFGVNADFFKARENSTPASEMVTAPRTAISVSQRSADILQFNVTATGEARIRLDVTLPVASAVPVLRMLLDAGLVLSPPE